MFLRKEYAQRESVSETQFSEICNWIIKAALSKWNGKFQANAAAMQTIVDDLKAKLAVIAQGGSASARAKHVARGKLLPRERVERLLDAGTPFLEVSPMAAYGMYDADIPAAGVIAGIGRVAGIDCMIVCNDATVKGGTYYPMTVKKHLRAQEIARENVNPHRSQVALWILWFLFKFLDAVFFVGIHDTKTRSLFDWDFNNGDSSIRFLVNMRIKEFIIVHLVDMVTR